MSSHPSDIPDATRKVRRPLHRLTEANVPVFEPNEDRSTTGVAAFLRGCKLEPARPTGVVPPLPRNLTGGHMVQVGDPSRYVFEIVIIRDARNACFGLYMPPPPDLRTRLPELGVVDLARSRANLTFRDGRQVVLSALTVDEVSHLIVLAQGTDQNETEEELDDIEIVFDEE